MSDIQRLKFAFARGARIQHDNCQEVVEEWRYTSTPLWGTICNYRVHPDDKHLEYGPMSTALRQYVVQPFEGDWLDAALSLYRNTAMHHGWYGTVEEMLMSYLFFAELLADEGL